jgi:hypothetical protein
MPRLEAAGAPCRAACAAAAAAATRSIGTAVSFGRAPPAPKKRDSPRGSVHARPLLLTRCTSRGSSCRRVSSRVGAGFARTAAQLLLVHSMAAFAPPAALRAVLSRHRVILGSKSASRQAILREMGVPYEIMARTQPAATCNSSRC